MSGKELYQKTFDEIKLSNRALTKLMLLNAEMELPGRRKEWVLYRLLKAFIGFVGFLLASGTLFRIPAV